MKGVVYIITDCKVQYLFKMLRLLGGQLQLLTTGKERKGRWRSCTDGRTVWSLWHLRHHHCYLLRSGATSVKQEHKSASKKTKYTKRSSNLIFNVYFRFSGKNWFWLFDSTVKINLRHGAHFQHTDIIYTLILVIQNPSVNKSCCLCRQLQHLIVNILKDLAAVKPAVVDTLCKAKAQQWKQFAYIHEWKIPSGY